MMTERLREISWDKLTTVVIAIILCALTAAGTLWAAGERQATTEVTQAQHSTQLADHESRLRVLEPKLNTIEAHVVWIRRYLEGGRDVAHRPPD